MPHTSSPSSGLALPASGSGSLNDRSFAEMFRKLGLWRETAILRQSLNLAGQPNSILDIPCGTGRLWPVLLEKTNRLIIGADDCAEMLSVAQATATAAERGRLRYLQTPLPAIDLPDSAVDCVFSVRLFTRVGSTALRRQLLQEFQRVTRDTLILSLWVDGNLQSWQRAARQPAPHTEETPPLRFVTPRQQCEAEFAAAGFTQLGHFDSLPLCQMARTYVLRKR